MFDLSYSECNDIDVALEEKLVWAANRSAEAEQLAMDASRLLSCTEDRLQIYVNQGFFKRCWFTLSGKTGALERATQGDLVEMQKYAWRYINLLQERDLMTAHSIIALKNNLLSLAIDQGELKNEVIRLADRVYDRFKAVEGRLSDVEVSQRIHGWLLTIDTLDYVDKYPENLRVIRVIADFYSLKNYDWNIGELRYLQKGLKEAGIDPKKSICVSEFIGGVVDDITALGFDEFSSILPPLIASNDDVIDTISSAPFNALYQIKETYPSSSRVVRSLQRKQERGWFSRMIGSPQGKKTHDNNIKFVITDFIDEMGIDTGAKLPLKDLATEILTCFSLSQRLVHNPSDLFMGAHAPSGEADSMEPRLIFDDARQMNDEVEEVEQAEEVNHVEEESETSRVEISIELGQVILETVKEIKIKDFYIKGGIPEHKHGNAIKSMRIPLDETVYALIDCTFFGSCEDGIAIGSKGIYWKNAGDTPSFLAWNLIADNNKNIFVKNNNVLQMWTSSYIYLTGSSVSATTLKDVLMRVSSFTIKEMCGGDAG